MLEKAVNGFTATEIDRALRGADLRMIVRIRGELFDLENVKLFDLKGLLKEGSVSQDDSHPIKRGASLVFLETPRDDQHSAPLLSFTATVLGLDPLFWLRLSEAAGNFLDSSPNGRTFTANGTPSYGLGSLAPGDPTDDAVGLSGDDYLSIADAAWMDVSAITLSIAYRGTTVSACLFDRDDGSSNRFFRLEIDSDGFIAFTITFTSGSPATKTFTTAVAINDGNSHLIHATYGGGFVRIYADGNRLLKTTETRSMATGTLGMRIGRTNADTLSAVATIDEAVMLGRALTAREIRDHYQAWSNNLTEILLDTERGDRVKVWYGIRMPRNGTDGTPYAEWPLILAILTSPQRNVEEDEGVKNTISCQDQTRVLADDGFDERTTCAAGTNFIDGVNGVRQIAESAGFDTSAWAVTSTTKLVAADIDFELGSSKLDAINYLLTSINYKPIAFSGSGAGIIEPNRLDVDIPLSDTLAADGQSVIYLEGLSEQIEPRKVINEVIVAPANPDVPD